MSLQTPTAPFINAPHYTGASDYLIEYSTNSRYQTITGVADELTARVLQNGSVGGMEFNPYPRPPTPTGVTGTTGTTSTTGSTGTTGTTGTTGSSSGDTGAVGNTGDLAPGQWRLTLPSNPSLTPGKNIFIIQAQGYDDSLSSPATLIIYLVEDGSLGFLVGAPTGISINRYTDRIKFTLTHDEDVNATTHDSLIVGFNYYAAKNPGGGLVGYTLLNTALVTDYDEIEDQLVEETSSVDRVVDPDDPDKITVVTTTTQELQRVYLYSFNHVRTNTSSSSSYPQRDDAYQLFKDVDPNQDLYYVATALAYDPEKKIEYESTYTSELPGNPLIISTRIKDLTPRTLNDVQQDLIEEILRVQSTIDVKPGSVTRDVHIDPPAWEANRIWLIIDYVNRAQSFLTLLQIDDPSLSGTSIAVSESQYKSALKVALELTDQGVQQLIDEAFEKLAGNSLTERQGATKSIGQAVLQRTSAPTQDLVVAQGTVVSSRSDSAAGIVGQSFITTSQRVMYAEQADSFFNPITGYYELTVPIEASQAGLAGNVAAGAIVSTNASGFGLVTNREATLFGQDQESNLSLAERAMLSFVSVDTGTAGGYLRTALDVTGVHRARIVEAGEPLMMRDWDEVRLKNIGGKVDVWIQGTAEIEVQQTFAFQYDQELGIRFELVGDASEYTFKTTSANVTPDTPIFAMLNDPSLGYGLRNVTTAEDFDLTNVEIIEYDTIRLDNTRPQPAVTVDDIVHGDYKYRDSDPFIPNLQPIRTISSIASPTSTLTAANWQLIKREDPLLLGYSVRANDQINIIQANGVPTGDPTTVTNENIVLVGSFQTPLSSVGVDIYTIVVTDATGAITYDSDLLAVPVPDYFITEGSLTEPPKIARNTAGRINNGQLVLVSYTAEENFTVTYAINNVLQLVAEDVDKMRHVTADVLVKQAIENEIDFACTVVLKEDADQADVDIEIRTNLSTLVNRLQIGQDLHQSDMIHEIESVDAVEYVILPLTLMHKADGSLILRDALDNDSTQVVEGVEADVWLINQQHTFSTSVGGGPSNLHRGVFMDTQPLDLFDLLTDFCELERTPGSALIIGADGIYIPGFNTPETAEETTGNRILVALPKGDVPEEHSWAVSYIVDGETGTGDIEAFTMEYLVLGEVTLTYTTDLDEYGNEY